MATNNSLQPAQKRDQSTTYLANGSEVRLSPTIVRDYLVSGDKDRVSMQEVSTFINLCKFQGLNPWLKEAYCIKYGSEPATMVVGKEAFFKRAEAHPAFDGIESGIICVNNGDVVYRCGSFHVADDVIIGGWAEVFRKDKAHAYRVEVPFSEYAGTRKDGSLNGQWAKKPGTMIRKVAQVQALREAFPALLGGMYTAEEQGRDEADVVIVPVQEQPAPPVAPTPAPAPAPEPVADELFAGLEG